MSYQNKNFRYINADAYDNRSISSVLEKYVLGLWQPFLKNKIEKLSDDKVVIDWGCGTGEYALAAKKSKKIYCLDISDIMLKRAREKLKFFDKKVEFISGSGFDNEIPESIGELVLTIGVWEYVDPIKLFGEIKRLTKKGNMVLAVFPNVYNGLNWMRSVLKMKKVALRPGYIKKLFHRDFTLVESASFGNVCLFPKGLQSFILPFWKVSDLVWHPFQKSFPLGVNVYYLFERK